MSYYYTNSLFNKEWNSGLFIKYYLVLVNIHFICHVHEAHDLRETRICTINTALEKNNYLLTNTAYVLQYSDTRVY